MKTNKKSLLTKSRIDPLKLRSFLAEEFPAEYSFGMIPGFEVKDFSGLTKREQKRNTRHVVWSNFKSSRYHKDIRGLIKQLWIIVKNILKWIRG